MTVVTADNEQIQARACILACGASYALQRRLGLGMPQVHLQSAQMELPAGNPGTVEVHFGTDTAPKGFGWVVPVVRDGRAFARIGLMCERDAREYFQRFLARVGPRWQIGSPDSFDNGMVPRAKILPLGPIRRTYAARLLAVGDAAGLVKATTGGGIYYSLLSARIAAETLSGALAANDLAIARCPATNPRGGRFSEKARRADATSARRASNQRRIDSLFESPDRWHHADCQRTARFNRHRDPIMALLSHPPARRVMRRVLGGPTA